MPTKILWSPTASINLLSGGCTCLPTAGGSILRVCKTQFLFLQQIKRWQFPTSRTSILCPPLSRLKVIQPAQQWPFLSSKPSLSAGMEAEHAQQQLQLHSAALHFWAINADAWEVAESGAEPFCPQPCRIKLIPPHNCWSQCFLQPPKVETLLLRWEPTPVLYNPHFFFLFKAPKWVKWIFYTSFYMHEFLSSTYMEDNLSLSLQQSFLPRILPHHSSSPTHSILYWKSPVCSSFFIDPIICFQTTCKR